MKPEQRMAAFWSVLNKVSYKEFHRPDLDELGAPVEVNLKITGDVGGEKVAVKFDSTLSVAAEWEKLSSVAVPSAELAARLLAEIPPRQREKLLEGLPQELASNGSLSDGLPEGLLEKSKHLLERLNTKKSATIKGSTTCTYALATAPRRRSPRSDK